MNPWRNPCTSHIIIIIIISMAPKIWVTSSMHDVSSGKLIFLAMIKPCLFLNNFLVQRESPRQNVQLKFVGSMTIDPQHAQINKAHSVKG